MKIKVLFLGGVAFLSLNAVLADSCVPAPPGLVSWWRAEGNALDSADGNNGALVGGASYGTGIVGHGFVFDGSSGYVRVPASSNLNVGLANGFTLETWINPADHSFQEICEWNRNNGTGTGSFGGGQIGTHLELNEYNADGSLWGNIIDTSANAHVINTVGGVITTNAWQHVAMTYHKTTGLAALYRNGVLVTNVNLGVFTPQTSSDFFLGSRPAGPFAGLYFKGGIDEVSVYNRALSAAEITAIYLAGSAGKCSSSTGSNYSLVLPVENTSVQGDACSGVLNEVLRYQNVYGASQFPTNRMLITELRFRPCSSMGAFSITISNIQINLSTTAAQPDALNSLFNNNVGADNTIVYQGPLSISSASTGTPKAFDIVVPLTQPFLYNPAAGNLLLEVRNYTGAPIGNIVDHAGSSTDAASRAYSYNASAAVADYLSTGSAIVKLIYSRVSLVPVITSVTPATAVPGANVIIAGLNFSSTPANNIVFFGAVRASVLSASSTSLMVTVPAGAIYAPITVNVGGLVAYSPKPFEPTFAGSSTPFTASSFAPRFDLAGGDGAHRSAIADLDGDGKPDIAVANAYGHTISLFRNISTTGLMSTASFATRVDLSAEGGSGDNPYGFATADVDGDGKLDLVACDRIGNNISVYRNVASPGSLTAGSFATRVNFKVGTDPRYARVADLDGDGRPDIVSCNYAANTISILRNIGTAGSLNTNSFAPHMDLPAASGPYDVAIADLDGDGKPDLAVVNTDGYSVSLYRNIGTTGTITTNSFAPRVDLSAPNGSDTIMAGDVDGDGKPDLVIGSYLAGTMSVFRNQSSAGSLTAGSFAARVDFYTGNWTHTVALGDLNGDGKVDIATVGELPSYLSLFQNVSTPGSITSASITPQVTYSSGWNGWGVSVGDLDGDSRPDVIFCNAYDDTVSVYHNVMPVAPPTNTCVPAPADLISWWRAEGNALDSADGNNGALAGGISYGTGAVGQGLVFDGSGGYVRVPASANLNVGLANGFTLETWIKPLDSSFQEICEWNRNDGTGTGSFGGGQIGTHLELNEYNADGSLWGNIIDTSANAHVINTVGGVITTSAWQHVAMTYDKTTGLAALYRNGVLVTNVNLGIFTPQTSSDFFIGRRPAGPFAGLYFKGGIDEVSVYNRALTADEIAAIYAAGSAGKCVELLPPVIVVQPTNQAVNVGATATFAVEANGSSPLFYQWFFGSNALAGATTKTLTLTNVQTSQAGTYFVVVSNLVDVAISSNALLYVNQWPVADASATDPYVVVCNTSNAAVVLNGTRSYDPDGDPLQYFWSEGGMPLATGMVAVVTLPLGIHPVVLLVSDGMATDTNGVTVKVVTATQAIADLIAVINASNIKHTQPLIVSLEAASASIGRCDPIPAANQLEAFQNKVRAQVAPDDPVLAQTLIDAAQEIINSLENCCGCGVHKYGKINARHGNNGRVHLEFEGSRGRCYVIEASSDLVHWETVGVAKDLADGTFEFEDKDSTGAVARFYRVVTP